MNNELIAGETKTLDSNQKNNLRIFDLKTPFTVPQGPVNKITNPEHQHIGKDHQVYDPVVDAFSSTLVALGLEYGTAHRTLGFRSEGQCDQ